MTMQLTETEYSKYRIDYLFHITHISNLESILAYGLFPHSYAYQNSYVTRDIADQRVIRLRAGKSAFGKSLLDFVPLYFTPQTPMLYVRKGIQDEIAIICVDRQLLCQVGSIFTDGNAANNSTTFLDSVKEIGKLDWEIIRSRQWMEDANRRGIGFREGKRRRCAEVLVPDHIPSHKIQRIIVRTEQAQLSFEHMRRPRTIGERRAVTPIRAEVQPRWFFED